MPNHPTTTHMMFVLLTFQNLAWLGTSYYPNARTGWSVERRMRRMNLRKDSCWGWASARNDDDNDTSTSPPRSVADYTMGLHGGKYQFDSNHGGGLSSVGQDFAAALYASDEPDQNVDYSTEEMPKWALRLSELDVNTLGPDVKRLPPDGTVIIANEEPTWERFYCFILPAESNDETSTSVVEPAVGILAPRGGQATLTVRASSLTKNPSWLVVGTEEARWVHAIR